MFKKLKNRGGILSLELTFGFGIFSYNNIEFEKDLLIYQVKTLIILFIKYERINYKYKNV